MLGAIAVLLVLIFSKYFYVAGIGSFYTFYLMEKFGLSVQSAQVHLFIFLFASAIGTVAGGPIGDRIGRKPVIWASILGVAPFALLLPHANLFWTTALTILIGLILSSAFSAILVYAQELMPGKVGMVSGLFFGFALAWAGSVPRCWACSRTGRASSSSTRVLRTCRCLVSSRRSCRRASDRVWSPNVRRRDALLDRHRYGRRELRHDVVDANLFHRAEVVCHHDGRAFLPGFEPRSARGTTPRSRCPGS